MPSYSFPQALQKHGCTIQTHWYHLWPYSLLLMGHPSRAKEELKQAHPRHIGLVLSNSLGYAYGHKACKRGGRRAPGPELFQATSEDTHSGTSIHICQECLLNSLNKQCQWQEKQQWEHRRQHTPQCPPSAEGKTVPSRGLAQELYGKNQEIRKYPDEAILLLSINKVTSSGKD